MARYLIIVARDQPDLYDYMRRRFSEVKDVRVLLDRRQGERRQRVQEFEAERRQADRRHQQSKNDALRTLGVIVTRPQEPALTRDE